jgi:hypothetical protein
MCVQWSCPEVKATDGAAVMVMLTEWERVPLVPVTLIEKLVPAGTPTKTVMKELLEPPAVDIVTGLGWNITVTPEGTAPLERVTLPVKVPILATVRTSDPDDPDGIVREDAAAVRLKSEVVSGAA